MITPVIVQSHPTHTRSLSPSLQSDFLSQKSPRSSSTYTLSHKHSLKNGSAYEKWCEGLCDCHAYSSRSKGSYSSPFFGNQKWDESLCAHLSPITNVTTGDCQEYSLKNCLGVSGIKVCRPITLLQQMHANCNWWGQLYYPPHLIINVNISL